jgi:hypothetical protein
MQFLLVVVAVGIVLQQHYALLEAVQVDIKKAGHQFLKFAQ